MAPAERARRFARFEPLLSLLLACLGGALVVGHLVGDSATIDEPVHIASAVEIARDGTGRWNPEHPPLAKALAGLALTGLPLSPVPDPLRSPAHGPILFRFLFENQTPGETILFRARIPFVGLFIVLVLAVAAESRRRFGPAAALVAAGLTAFEPNLIGHAGVVHTDLAVTLAIVLSLGPLRRLVQREDRFASLQLGLLWGIALLCKYDAPLLALITLPLLFVETPGEVIRPRTLGRLALAAGIALAVTLVGFAIADRHQSPADREALAHDRLLLKGRSPAAESAALAAGRILPAAGNLATGALSIVLQSRVGAGVNYFLGRVSPSGSPFYFPVAILTKISLSLFAAALFAFLLPRHRRYAAALALGLLIFLVVSAGSTYNIGVRHVLFAFPFAAMIASSAAARTADETDPFLPSRNGRGLATLLVGLLAVSQLAETLAVHPHELSFFNAAAGGLAGGRRFFVDSNLDWGQDLDRLARAAPRYSDRTLPAIVFGGDLPFRHTPLLGPLGPGDEEREGAIVAIGEAPLALGPELLASKGAVRDAARLERLRSTLHARGTRIGEIGGSIGIWRIGR